MSVSANFEPISRKRIICQSQSDLTGFPVRYTGCDNDEQDIWYSQEKLYQDHIQEILMKYQQLDDDIWGKLIYMQRNRRVAKVYTRAPVVNINGGTEMDFDGWSLGLSAFGNVHRDKKVDLVTAHMGDGVKLRHDQEGNILVRNLAEKSFYVKDWHRALLEPASSCMSDELIKSRGRIVAGKSLKLFDMKKFLTNISIEMVNQYPDRKALESQCISVIGFSKESGSAELLNQPVWVMVINIVALEMLKSESALGSILNPTPKSLSAIFDCPPTQLTTAINSAKGRAQRKRDIRDKDEAPYSSSTSSGSTGSSGLGRSSATMDIRSNLASRGDTIDGRGKGTKATPGSTPGKVFTKSLSLTSSVRRRQRKEAKVLPSEPSGRPLSLGSTFKLAPFESPIILEDPVPDYDTETDDLYYHGFQARVTGFADTSTVLRPRAGLGQPGSGCLNSVFRRLPLQAATKTASSSNILQSNQSSSSGAQDSDEIYAHIYSSISDSRKGTVKSKAKRSASIPKTWRFFMKK
ncbi:hypothetical protein HDE_12088 [Halotydeus destructor]|nr:hypothetical protein HDE_12088 [Halotydeus destructor]